MQSGLPENKSYCLQVGTLCTILILLFNCVSFSTCLVPAPTSCPGLTPASYSICCHVDDLHPLWAKCAISLGSHPRSEDQASLFPIYVLLSLSLIQGTWHQVFSLNFFAALNYFSSVKKKTHTQTKIIHGKSIPPQKTTTKLKTGGFGWVPLA